MGRYLLRRVASLALVLWIVVTATFVLMHAIPGGPFASEKRVPDEILQNLESKYRLDQPLWRQYLDYLVGVVTWDLGPSFTYPDRTVNDIIRDGFPVSATVGAIAVVVAVLVGIPAGVVAALRPNRWPDLLAMFGATIGVSVPSFILATALMYVFAYRLGWLPAALWGTPAHLVMPVLALAALPGAFFARITRSSLLEVLQQDYIRTARAKGLSWAMVIWRHALKNALIPVVTYMGPLLAGILTGSFVVESIFAVPGLGRHFVTSIYNRDYTVIMGVTVFFSALLVVLNLLVDLVYVLLDPRIRYE